MNQLSITKKEEVISLYLQGKRKKEIKEITQLNDRTIARIISQTRLDTYNKDLLKDNKTKLLQIIQDDVLNELTSRDLSDESIRDLTGILKTSHTMEREDTGKSASTVQMFFDLLNGTNSLYKDDQVLDAEWSEVENE